MRRCFSTGAQTASHSHDRHSDMAPRSWVRACAERSPNSSWKIGVNSLTHISRTADSVRSGSGRRDSAPQAMMSASQPTALTVSTTAVPPHTPATRSSTAGGTQIGSSGSSRRSSSISSSHRVARVSRVSLEMSPMSCSRAHSSARLGSSSIQRGLFISKAVVSNPPIACISGKVASM